MEILGPKPDDVEITAHELLAVIKADPFLSDEDRKALGDRLKDPGFLNRLLYGGFGAGLSLIVSKYLKLSPKARILMSMAGFGIGNLLLQHSQDKKRFATYNSKANLYEINQ